MASNALISIVPQEQDLQLYQGAPFTWNFAVFDSTNTALNMTGGSILATIRSTQAHSGNTLIATFTCTWINQAAGTFTLSLTSATTDAFNWSGNAYYDVFFQDGNRPQNDYPLLWGIVTLQNDVSY
jgi:hypothetical protein